VRRRQTYKDEAIFNLSHILRRLDLHFTPGSIGFRKRHGMNMASITSLRRFNSLAGRALPGLAMIAQLSAAQAAEPASPCGNAISILNEGKNYEVFDKQSGGGEKRLRFRLDGKEPCPGGECTAESKAETKAEGKEEGKEEGKTESDAEGKAASALQTRAATRIEIVARAAAAEKVIATVDLTGRTASYCVYELSRVDVRPDPRRTGCPRSYLRNFLTIKLVDGDGPFARRDVDIQYLYRADGGAGSLDHCTSPAILDGMFRRRVWTVPLEDGAAAYIGETDFPRDRRPPVPRDPPFATTVFGARPE
jgi:hypothetical protein